MIGNLIPVYLRRCISIWQKLLLSLKAWDTNIFIFQYESHRAFQLFKCIYLFVLVSSLWFCLVPNFCILCIPISTKDIPLTNNYHKIIISWKIKKNHSEASRTAILIFTKKCPMPPKKKYIALTVSFRLIFLIRKLIYLRLCAFLIKVNIEDTGVMICRNSSGFNNDFAISWEPVYFF